MRKLSILKIDKSYRDSINSSAKFNCTFILEEILDTIHFMKSKKVLGPDEIAIQNPIKKTKKTLPYIVSDVQQIFWK